MRHFLNVTVIFRLKLKRHHDDNQSKPTGVSVQQATVLTADFQPKAPVVVVTTAVDQQQADILLTRSLVKP